MTEPDPDPTVAVARVLLAAFVALLAGAAAIGVVVILASDVLGG
jgi:hypothetical protein